MKAKTNQIPNDSWSLGQLAKFCTERRQRIAFDAWCIGKALSHAKKKCKATGESFTDWKAKNGFSDATVSRYVRLFEQYDPKKDQEFLAKSGVMDALAKAGIAKRKKATLGKNDNATPPWAVKVSEPAREDIDDRTVIARILAPKEPTLKDSCEGFSFQINLFRKKVEYLAKMSIQSLLKVCDFTLESQKTMLDDIDAVLKALPALATALKKRMAA